MKARREAPAVWGAEGVICGPGDRQGNSQAKGSWLDGSLENLQGAAGTEGIMISGQRTERDNFGYRTNAFTSLSFLRGPIDVAEQCREAAFG